MNMEQKVVTRQSKTINAGYMGFNDYETKYENFNDFVKRVTDLMNELNTIFVSYPDCNTAIIQYWIDDVERNK